MEGSTCGWNQIFMGKFWGQTSNGFFACFSGLFDWIMLILVWFERSLPNAQVRYWQCCHWPKRVMYGDPHMKWSAIQGRMGWCVNRFLQKLKAFSQDWVYSFIIKIGKPLQLEQQAFYPKKWKILWEEWD